MTLEIVRRVRGNLHGSIDISELEDKVIAHPIVQRLRRIKQTAFLSYVFPGASHSRFEHSLGVMNLAGVAWNKIMDNQKRLYNSSRRYPNFAEREQHDPEAREHGLLSPTYQVMGKLFESDYTLQTLRLAALLHDIGHPPFSHSGERFLPSLPELVAANKDLPGYVRTYFERTCERWQKHSPERLTMPVRHEMYTIMLVDQLLADVYRQHPELKLKVAAQDVVSIISPDIPPLPGSELVALGVHKLCHELVSGEIDIDRMDYLQRDSRECGVVYGMFDLDRIMDSLSLYYDSRDKVLHLAIQFSGLAAFEDYLRARQSMYIQLYFHKTSVACEAMLQSLARLLPNFTLPANRAAFVACDETTLMSQFLAAGEANISNLADRERFAKLVTDLFYDRRLWKRVYEFTSGSSQQGSDDEIEQAKAALSKAGIDFEQISPKNSLTKFRPRKKREKSRNYLRLIKKDGKQFPRVVPIEDYSTLISSDNQIAIDRLYVEVSKAEKARELLMETFYNSSSPQGLT